VQGTTMKGYINPLPFSNINNAGSGTDGLNEVKE